ncbi:hypothetical protein ONZ51_g12941 [Trametes cubensis]|uniref:HNH nuclease domain-containing protein n=1 Tax=Trametes cubensis TaxID=1111947 RepID=A0AAD7TEW8_9APHY|nr:hypothetical protein ONZ51_g12941 [Trametes cubensis]
MLAGHRSRSIEGSPLGSKVIEIINSRHVSDEELYERAQKHLSVLSHPLYAQHSRPAWVKRLKNVKALSRLKTEYTTARMINAMYETATNVMLQPRACVRYVSAAVCAAGSAQQNGDGAAMPADEDAERLAGALERLASTWVSYMLWPFAARDRAAKEFDGISSSGYATPNPADIVSRLRKAVLRRDKYTCAYTGLIDADHSEIDGSAFWRPTLEVAHIFKRAVARPDDGVKKASVTL